MSAPIKQALENFFKNIYSPQPALVAVSGGPDSLVLLHALLQLQPHLPAMQIEAAHFNHHIRGEAAAADARFVEDFCRENNLLFHLGEYDVPAFAAANSFSLEDAARRTRYAFLGNLAARLNIGLVLTGHNADDQAETVLLRLLRGTGPHGLAGMTALSNLPPTSPALKGTYPQTVSKEVQLGRPLLTVWRRDIEAYAVENNLTPRLDETNLQPDYARNRVRHHLLPLLESEYQPQIKQNLIRLASLTRDDQAWLDALMEEEFLKNAKFEFGCRYSFSKEYFLQKPPALQKRLIRRTAGALHSLENLDAAHIEAALALFNTAKMNHLDLPGKLVAFVGKNEVGLLVALDPVEWPENGLELVMPGRLDGPAGRWRLEAAFVKDPQTVLADPRQGGPYHVFLDYAKISTPLRLRPRRTGERYRPLGAPGQRKVQDIMLDARIPRELRWDWPVVICPAQNDRPEAICWIPGAPVAHDFRLMPETASIIELRFDFIV